MSRCGRVLICGLVLWGAPLVGTAGKAVPASFRSIDLAIGQERAVMLVDGTQVKVKLLRIEEYRDPVRKALRRAEVTVCVNGVEGTLVCATYNLPVELGGVRIDCPAVKGYIRGYRNVWALDRDARLRIWPKSGPLIHRGTFRYPLPQRWAACGTQFDGEIGDGEIYGSERYYYHQGF
ncbi:MAG: hypothetical protein GXP27_08735, partial [Planctomycetes bacterium]|nr:hypothetical protein [Planctomycetota bacterium]